MEKQPLLHDTLQSNNSNENYRKCPSIHWTIFMWTLGLIEWSHPRETNVHRGYEPTIIQRLKWRRRCLYISSMSFLLLLFLSSIFTAVWYFMCFLARQSQFLGFTSYALFYWPVVTSSQVVCLVAAIKNVPNSRFHVDDEISWCNIFSENYFASRAFNHLKKRRRLSKIFTFVFFYTFALINALLEIGTMLSRKRCKFWPKYICLFSNIGGLFFYATFCHFLYLNRLAVQEESRSAVAYFRSHLEYRKSCIAVVREFFKGYLRLRKILFPWLNLIIFSTTFGMAIFFTSNYDDITQISSPTGNFPTASPKTNSRQNKAHWIEIRNACNDSCEGNSTLLQHEHSLLFDLMIFSEKVMIMALALIAVGAMDLSYIWDRVKIDIKMLCPIDENCSQNYLKKFIKGIHPNRASATFVSFIIPLLGIACGTLSGRWQIDI